MDEELLFRSLERMTSEREEAAVTRWRRSAAENELRYQELSRLLAALSNADAARLADKLPPRASDIVERSREFISERDLTLRSASSSARIRTWLVTLTAIAAVVIAAVAFWQFRPRASATPHLAVREVVTGASEFATVSLLDGSVVRLGPNSRLQLDTSDSRKMALEGHAYFAVAKQKAGPLRVRTSAGDVQVVGTRFDLEARGDQLRLVVVEGRVILDARGSLSEVNARQMVRASAGVSSPVAEIPLTIPHLEGLGNFLAFQNTPIRDAAREIEGRFQVRIQIADSVLGSRMITAWFSNKSLDDVLDVVCLVANAQCSRSEGLVIMRPDAGR